MVSGFLYIPLPIKQTCRTVQSDIQGNYGCYKGCPSFGGNWVKKVFGRNITSVLGKYGGSKPGYDFVLYNHREIKIITCYGGNYIKNEDPIAFYCSIFVPKVKQKTGGYKETGQSNQQQFSLIVVESQQTRRGIFLIRIVFRHVLL